MTSTHAAQARKENETTFTTVPLCMSYQRPRRGGHLGLVQSRIFQNRLHRFQGPPPAGWPSCAMLRPCAHRNFAYGQVLMVADSGSF